MGSDLSTADEWLELTSIGTQDIDVSGWTVWSMNSSGVDVVIATFPAGSVIQPGASRVVSHYGATQSRLSSEPWLVSSAVSLPNTKLRLMLKDGAGNVMDTVDDGVGSPMAGANPSGGGTKASMERIDLLASGTDAANWRTATESMNFDAGVLIMGTPAYTSFSSQVTSSAVSSSQSSIQPSPSSASESSLAVSSEESFSASSLWEQESSSEDSMLLEEITSESSSEVVSSSSSSVVSSSSKSSAACVPTTVGISLQSGSYSGTGKATFNIQVVAQSGTLTGAHCTVDFGDGVTSDSCNPPSHTIDEPGSYTLMMEMTDHCGNTVVQSLPIEVYEPIQSSSSSKSVSQVVTVQTQGSSTSSLLRSLPGAVGGDVSLTGVLPNPPGKDSTATEWVELTNLRTAPLSLQGWVLTMGDKRAVLDSIELKPLEKHQIAATVLGFSIRNTDASMSLSYDGEIQQTITWKNAEEGIIYHPNATDADSIQATVLRVIDGDTIEVLLDGTEKKVTVRLLGIDAPEMGTPFHTKQPYSEEAKKFLTALIQSKKVELQFDTERQDTFGRTLAYIELLDGSDVEEILLSNGLVRTYAKAHVQRSLGYESIESEAKKAKRGLWSLSDNIDNTIQEIADEDDLETDTENTVFSLQSGLGENMIFLSEVYPSPEKDAQEWIEIFNAGNADVDLSGWSIDDVKNAGSKPWKIEKSIVIAPGQFLVFQKSETKLSFTNSGEEVSLLAPDGTVADLVSYPSIKTGKSYSKNEDTWCKSDPTPGAKNSCSNTPVVSVKKNSTKSILSSALGPLKTSYESLFLPEEETETGTTISTEFEPLSMQVINSHGALTVDKKSHFWTYSLAALLLIGGFGGFYWFQRRFG